VRFAKNMAVGLTLVVGTSVSAGLGGCATPGEELSQFGYAASTPLRDLNITGQPVPGQLRALNNPFGYGNAQTCQALIGEVQALTQSVNANSGRYVGFRRDNSTRAGRFGNARDVGVASAVTSFIPFYPLFRQVTGAAARDQRAEAANNRARLRIGYLVGQGRAYRCPGF
jgi:hypothetical protein